MIQKTKMDTSRMPHHILFGCSEMPGHSRVEGLSLSAAYTEKSVEGIQEFDFWDDDVIVAGYPRTGSTLVQEIVHLLRHHEAPSTNITDRIPCLEYHGRALCMPPLGLQKAAQLPANRIFKTHLPVHFLTKPLEQGVKIICVLRNPKDVCASFYEYYKGMRLWGNWKFNCFEHLFFNTDKLSFGSIFDHYVGFWDERWRHNVLVVFYEDLVRNRDREIRKIAKFLRTDVKDMQKIAELTSFDSMKENEFMNPIAYQRNTAQVRLDYEFYTRGMIGSWREYFDQSMNKRADDVIKQRLTSEGIYFNYGCDISNGEDELSRDKRRSSDGLRTGRRLPVCNVLQINQLNICI